MNVTIVDCSSEGERTTTGEYINMLFRGYLGNGWEAKYNEYIKKMKDAGLNQYIAEVQKQLTEYAQKINAKW